MNSKDLNSIAEAYAKMNIRGNDSEEQKKRLEKKRGMKLDDHPQFKKEDLEQIDEKGMNPGFKAYLEKQKKKGGDKEEGDAPKGGGKPDFIDLDKDGDKKESMKKAAQDKKKGMGEQVHLNDISKTYLDQVAEIYKGKHGQSEKEYQDSRSDAGKMVSGDSKMSGAAYSSRSMKGTGPNPAGGSKKPAGQGRMTSGARTDLQFRKAAMKKEELEATGLFSEKEIAAIEEAMSSYDRNRKRAAERAAARNAARDAGKTGVVPGVGYVTPRRERETYVDSAGTTRHKSGAKMPKD